MRWIGGFLCLLAVSCTQPVAAATLYLDPPRSEVNLGDVLIVQVRLDTDELAGECINAVSGVIQLSGPVTPVDVSLGTSIFPFWIEQPTVNLASKRVSFAGGVPNGYCGRVAGDPRLTNQLFELVVRTDGVLDTDQDNAVATISFTSDTTAYLNDGAGSPAALDLLPAQILVANQFGEAVQDPWVETVQSDTIPPQEFSISLEQDPFAFQGKYFISFNTTDKQTGIDRYEVIEEPLHQLGSFTWGQADAPWRQVRSPYVLGDQSLNSIVRVRAIDKAGNEYIANYIPDESLRTTSVTQLVTFIVVLASILVVAVIILVLVRRRRQSHSATTPEPSSHNEVTPPYEPKN